LARANRIELCIELSVWNDPYGVALMGLNTHLKKRLRKRGAWMKKYVRD
jgi:hypothetical protein